MLVDTLGRVQEITAQEDAQVTIQRTSTFIEGAICDKQAT